MWLGKDSIFTRIKESVTFTWSKCAELKGILKLYFRSLSTMELTFLGWRVRIPVALAKNLSNTTTTSTLLTFNKIVCYFSLKNIQICMVNNHWHKCIQKKSTKKLDLNKCYDKRILVSQWANDNGFVHPIANPIELDWSLFWGINDPLFILSINYHLINIFHFAQSFCPLKSDFYQISRP